MNTNKSQLLSLFNEAMDLHQRQHFAQAQTLYRKVLQLQPNHINALHMLGVMALQVQQYRHAEELIGRAVALAPKVAPFHCNHASALLGLGEFEKALLSCDKAVASDPVFAQGYLKRGEVLQKLNRSREAISCFDKAIELAPESPEAWFHRGSLRKSMGLINDAMSDYQQTLLLKPAHEQAATAVTALLIGQNRHAAAYQHIQAILSRYPDRVLMKTALSKVLKKLVPEWHVPMMNEEMRNAAYYNALRRAVTPDSLVLEIGTGSGLLAMMAAQTGAKKVVTCEGVPLIADVAAKIISDNGFSDRVDVISKLSSNLAVGKELHEKADILVSEIFSSELLGEHVLSSLEDAKKRLIKDTATVIPANGSIMIALFGGEALGMNLWVDQVSGFDMRRFNTIRATKQSVFRADLKPEFFTEPVAALHFDFVTNSAWPAQRKLIDISVSHSGLCYGIMQWIRFELLPGIVYENHPALQSQVSNWQRVVYLFDEPRQLQKGEILTIKAEHDRVAPWFEVVSRT